MFRYVWNALFHSCEDKNFRYMNFTISSSALLSLLQNTGKVIPPKATMPILDYFLFNLSDGKLSVTATDLETTMISEIRVDTVEEEGVVAITSKLLIDALRELSDQPVNITVDKSTYEVILSWRTGRISIPGLGGAGYPELASLADESQKITIPADNLLNGVSKTIFATGEGELHPVMNGIYFDITPEAITFVATDAFKLAKITMRGETGASEAASFVLPKKPALLLRALLSKETENVSVEFDSRYIVFTLSGYKLITRAIEGRYPNYNSVIPTNNTNKVIVDRVAFLGSIRRVSVCSSAANSLVKFTIEPGRMVVAAQDTDFSVSAEDTIECNYEGEPLAIGFKHTILVEMLSNISAKEVSFELADSTRPGLVIPAGETDEFEAEMVMLLMPILS